MGPAALSPSGVGEERPRFFAVGWSALTLLIVNLHHTVLTHRKTLLRGSPRYLPFDCLCGCSTLPASHSRRISSDSFLPSAHRGSCRSTPQSGCNTTERTGRAACRLTKAGLPDASAGSFADGGTRRPRRKTPAARDGDTVGQPPALPLCNRATPQPPEEVSSACVRNCVRTQLNWPELGGSQRTIESQNTQLRRPVRNSAELSETGCGSFLNRRSEVRVLPGVPGISNRAVSQFAPIVVRT